MKNLSLSSIYLNEIPQDVCPELCCISLSNIYIASNFKLFEYGAGDKLTVFDIKQDNLTSIPVHVADCTSSSQVIVSFSGGELLKVESYSGNIELVGCIEQGVRTAAWSPAEDLFAVITATHSLLLFNQDLEPISETELAGSGEEKQVSVGWGKKETQFRGSEGKLKETSVQTTQNRFDDSRVRISWRGDGEFVCVSYEEKGERFLKIVSKDGTLVHSSEPNIGLESALCWRPNGSIIASTQKILNKHLVCFFEKNLLPHGSFQLNGNYNVEELLWNCDSSVLAVVCVEVSQESRKNCVKLFTVGNYHWYEKHTIAVPCDEKLVAVEWDKSESYQLHIVTYTAEFSKLKHTRWSYRWTTDVSSGASKDDQAWAAVVDGERVLLTAFRKAIIPPPMSSATLELNKPINSVGFLQFGAENDVYSSNDLFVMCENGNLSIFKYDETTKKHNLNLTQNIGNKIPFQVSWVAADLILGCAIGKNGAYEMFLVIIGEKSLEIRSKIIEKPFVAIRRVPNEKAAFILDENGVKCLDLISLESTAWLKPTPNLVGKLLSSEIRNKVFLLDTAHRLYADEALIASNVTSFRVSEEHLLVSTLQHKLLCWELTNLGAVGYERAVERGARIVTSVPGSSSVVLQMPRGNLEVVLPRALTITALKKLLDNLEYLKALIVMRKERVNLNLLYDHNPQNFESNLKHFVDEISDPNLLCNFIAELSNDNVTQTLYSNFYTSESVKDLKKVEKICRMILLDLESREVKAKFLLPILSCLVKIGETENALLLVQQTLAAEKRGEAIPVTSSEGLTHILYLVDVEQLFKIALGTYDLNLVMFIASKSQKDPKEYLPFLANLQKMDESYQKFTIDHFLKRHKKALGHLALCQDRVTECLDYVVKYDLYRAALRMFATDTDSWKGVCVQYGAELTRQARHDEAGVILERAGEYLLAQHAYARAGDWRNEIACAEAMRMSEDQKKDIMRVMVDSLLTSRRYEEAGRLLVDHLGDIVGGVTALCAANQHAEAIRIAGFYGRRDLVGTIVRTSANSACETLQQTIHAATDTMDKYVLRLREIFKERQNQPNGVDWDDSASESSRGSSRSSSRTSASVRSAKNARKLERNLMKKGGPFEDMGIIAALHDTITQMIALKPQIRALNLVLASLDESYQASKLQNLYQKFLERLKADVKEVWSVNVTSEGKTSNSIAAAYMAERQQLPSLVQALQPKILFQPDLMDSFDWELDILKDF